MANLEEYLDHEARRERSGGHGGLRHSEQYRIVLS